VIIANHKETNVRYYAVLVYLL